jgi:hypothetical protein
MSAHYPVVFIHDTFLKFTTPSHNHSDALDIQQNYRESAKLYPSSLPCTTICVFPSTDCSMPLLLTSLCIRGAGPAG